MILKGCLWQAFSVNVKRYIYIKNNSEKRNISYYFYLELKNISMLYGIMFKFTIYMIKVKFRSNLPTQSKITDQLMVILM